MGDEFIPKAKCVTRGVYEIKSRNLLVGVCNGKGGFVGIRDKFHHRFLFTEFHWEVSPRMGTVQPIRLIEMLPDGIEVQEHVVDPEERCREGRPTVWRPDDPSKGRTPGWRYHKDNGSRLLTADFPGIQMYQPLYDYLDPIERRLNEEWRKDNGR